MPRNTRIGCARAHYFSAASMRPRRDAAEYPDGKATALNIPLRFNEAAA